MMLLGLIGERISHSVSPSIHHTLLRHVGLDGQYGILDVSKDKLETLLAELYQKRYQGVNVTVPHKQSVVPFLDELSPSAKILQAVNTIVFQYNDAGECHLVGHNTDVSGFWNSVPKEQQTRVPDQNVLLMGAGGAARAVLAAILAQQPKKLLIAGQSPERLVGTLKLAEKLNQQSGGKTELETTELSKLGHTVSQYQWLINATPIGTGNQDSPLTDAQVSNLSKAAFISDLVYHPRRTELLKLAEAHGISGQNGLGMLMHQAMDAFTLWTGIELADDALEQVRHALDTPQTV